MYSCEKHSSLLQSFIAQAPVESGARKSVKILRDTIKLFTVVIYSVLLLAEAFVTATHFHPSLIFIGKAKHYWVEPALQFQSWLGHK